MKKLFFGFVLLLMVIGLSAQDASMSFTRFNSAAGGFVDLSLHISGRTIAPKVLPDSSVMGAVDVLVLFQEGEEIVKYDKFRLNSPAGQRVVDIVDLHRYALPEGKYEIKVEINDVTTPDKVRKYRAPLTMAFADDALEQSDIQLLASVSNGSEDSPFYKNGVLMEPLPFNFLGRGVNQLQFYSEIYGSDTYIGDAFMVSYRVDKLENGDAKSMLIAHKRLDPSPVNPLLLNMDITNLPSGNYQLVVDVRDRERTLLSTRKTEFQRSNPILDAQNFQEAMAEINIDDEFVGQLSVDEVEYSLRAIAPLLPQPDVELVDILIRTDSTRAMRSYLYGFWLRENPGNPQQTYAEFMEVARAVDQMFQSGFRHGFETDRGYVYIKYGRPNDMTRRETEPSAPPYEIWSYNEIERTNQNNVRFIFYNPTLAADDFVLLHSDVIGEIQNPQWELELYRDSPSEGPADYFGGDRVNDNIGRRARRLVDDY